MRPLSFTALRPKPPEARGGPKFKGLRLLLTCDIERIAETDLDLFRAAAAACGKEFAPDSVKLGTECGLFKLNNLLQTLVDSLETFFKSPHNEACFREIQLELRQKNRIHPLPARQALPDRSNAVNSSTQLTLTQPLASRTNTMLSIPMLFRMVGQKLL